MELNELSICNPQALQLPGPGLLHQLVTLYGEKVALDYMGANRRLSLTYTQLQQASDALAIRISEAHGNRSGPMVVPVLTHQSPLLYVSLLAILKAGGAYCPLNIDAPPERVRFILKDVSAAVVIISNDLHNTLPRDIDAKLLVVTEEDCFVGTPSEGPRTLRNCTPQELAYVMYTSGSTGTPKGVGISHGAATQALLAHDRHIPSFSRFLQFAAPTFDVSVFETFFPLYRGSTLVSIRRSEMLNDLPAVMRAMDVDACELTPTVAGSLLRKRANVPKLSLLLTIGEMLNAPVVEEFGGSDTRPSMLWAMYGPTEATIHCTLQTAFKADSATGNIGHPLDTVSCFVIQPVCSSVQDGDFQPLPRGEVGELAVGGYQLADGYINRPEQTEKAFIQTPFGRVYRTGDKARMLADGRLECYGRLSDGQVKLRGQRMELGEVEQAVLRTSGCHSAVAMVVNSILVVFCAVDEGTSTDAVLANCRDWLPQFMIPGEVVSMPELPRLPSGKVDRKLLRADYEERYMISLDKEPEGGLANEVSSLILNLVSSNLGTNVHLSTSLKRAGLDSLRSIKLASALREAGFEISSSELLSMECISDIALAAQTCPTSQSLDPSQTLMECSNSLLSAVPPLQQMSNLIEGTLVCTPQQIAMLAETSRKPSTYCNEIELTVPGAFLPEQVSATFAELALRNEILRSGFAAWDGSFVTIVFTNLRGEQMMIIEEFDHEFRIASDEEFLRPVRLQVQSKPSDGKLRLLLHLHHAVYDGWSMDMLLKDWSKLLSQDIVASRPTFRHVIGYYRKGGDSKRSPQTNDSARTFWAEYLNGWYKAPAPRLSDQPAAPVLMKSPAKLSVSRQQVESGLRDIGCGSQVLFQASLGLIWGRVLGSSDVVLGSVTSGRTIPIPGVDRIIGPCLASFPLRIKFEDISETRDLFTRLHSSNLNLMQHGLVSLSEVKSAAGMQPGETLYDILFVYQESLESLNRGTHLLQEVQHLDRLETPVLFEIEPVGDDFILQVTHQSDFVTPRMMSELMQQFDATCVSLLNHRSESIDLAVRKLEVSESVYNASPTEFSTTLDLASSFSRTTTEIPNNLALCFFHSLGNAPRLTSLTFQELNVASNQLAAFLKQQGSRPGHVVAIILEKSVQLYVSILAVIKAGYAYLPLLPSTPTARIEQIFEQAEIGLCLTGADTIVRLPISSTTQYINVKDGSFDQYTSSDPDPLTNASSLAYVIYTSGTTGVPKGVAVRHSNIIANIEVLRTQYPKRSTGQGRVLQLCSQAFDMSVFEIFFAWSTGMCLCSATNDIVFEDLESSIRQMDISHLSITPTMASLITPASVPNVEFLVTAGEPLTQTVSDRWSDQLWQGYGPSETTNICTVKKMKRGYHIEHLGYALPNTSAFVFSPDGTSPLPWGWVGELCFGGDQVADGYYNMPDLTSKKFISQPPFGRLYRSGDLGRMLPDGSLVIVGRLDDQIKLRGQRIEIVEINTVATSSDGVDSAVTILIRTGDTPEHLILFYVPRTNGSADFDTLEIDSETHNSLLGLLKTRLPNYMIPSYLIPVSIIPRTSSGKIDRLQLRQRFSSMPQQYLEAASSIDQSSTEQRNWSTLETEISKVLADFTNSSRERIGRWTPLTILGVDSISAIGLARRLASEMQSRVSVSDILQNPTVAQLARRLTQNLQRCEDVASDITFEPEFTNAMTRSFARQGKKVDSVLPCTPLQEAMLLRGHNAYYNKVLLRLHIDPEEMRSYWDIMSQRHEILRTCFVTTTDSQRAIAQVVIQGWKIPWEDFEVNDPSFDGAIQDHLQTLPDPVDSYIPPVSLALLRYRESAFISFICHHALYDGVAMETLLKEIESIAAENQLPPAVSYKNFLQTALKLPSNAESFWLEQFRGYRSSTLFPKPTTNKMDHCTHTSSLELPLSDVQTQLRHLGISLLSICQASWAGVLSAVHRHSDVCFGNVVSGRTVELDGLERLVAPCFNTIPIRIKFSKDWLRVDLAKRLQNLNTKLLPYQFTPLRFIQKRVRGAGRSLFDTLLLLQQPLQDIDRRVWTLEGDSGDMDIPLVCEVVPCPSLNSVVINIHRDMSLVTGEAAAALVETFKGTFKSILSSPLEKISDIRTLHLDSDFDFESLRPRLDKVEGEEQYQDSADEWSQSELIVQNVLSELSGVTKAQVHRLTTIFQLGLDSINAVQVASTLRQQGFEITASDVIEFPNCARIATKMVLKANETQKTQPTYDFSQFHEDVSQRLINTLPKTEGIEAILPCTPMQSAMISSFLQSNGNNYLNTASYLVNTDISVKQLADAWNLLQSRHAMLRTGFIQVNHQDATFAMVRYRPGTIGLPLQTLPDQTFDVVEVQKQRSKFGKQIATLLHVPPWKVNLVPKGTQITMDLFIHHALYDAISLQIILEELSLLLNGQELKDTPLIEPALSVILHTSTGKQADSRGFWASFAEQAVVNNFPIMTPLRVDERHMMANTMASSLSYSTIQHATLTANISTLAVIQAAWTRLLAAYLGESSVVFGMTLSGRTTDETRSAVFPCLNTIPVIASNDTTDQELLRHMMSFNQQAHKHQFVPLAEIQKCLGYPARAIFDTLIVYQKYEGTDSTYTPWRLVDENAMVDYPVSLEVIPQNDDRVLLTITYQTDVLPQQQADLMIKQFDYYLAQMIKSAVGKEAALALHPDLFSILPATHPIIHAPVQLLHEFVELGSVQHPDKPALEFVYGFEGEKPTRKTWTYLELNQMGNRVANLLSSHATPGSIVGLLFNKCPEAYFSILGILKAGCSFVALDPTAPKARKQFIIEDSEAPCLLMKDDELLDFETTTQIVTVDENTLMNSEYSDLRKHLDISPTATCYCLYTSGTTGTPKGCEITHENTVQAMMAFQDLFHGHWESNSRWLQFASLHFDVSVLEQYWSWSVGISVVSAPKDVILDDLTATIRRLDITHIDLTPSLARLTHPKDVPSLCRGVFITGGEQLKQEILDVWGPKSVIYNAYGPTEATIGVTMYQQVPVNGRPSNIGRQFPNVGSYVFRSGTNTPVVRGGVGELCVSGKLVGKGYLNRVQLTEERFPTIPEFGEKVYRTGDHVRVLHNGCFDFLGRADDQVKLRGQRLEIAEIDHVIRTYVAEIRDSATIVTSHGSSGKDILVSFIVGDKSESEELAVISDRAEVRAKAREVCLEKLPGYMIPTYFLTLPYIPLSSNNKAEVRSLKRLFEQLTHDQLSTLSRGNTLVSKGGDRCISILIEVLAEISGIKQEELHPSISIFDVGVDSITALRLSSLLRQRGLNAASPAVILRYPIISDLATFLAKSSSVHSGSSPRGAVQSIRAYGHRYRGLVIRELGLQHQDIEYVSPCSPLQEGIISRAMSIGLSGAYFNTFCLDLGLHASKEILRAAWEELIKQEAILRTRFVATPSGYVQAALKKTTLPWQERHFDKEDHARDFIKDQENIWVSQNSQNISRPLILTYLTTPTSSRLIIHIFHGLYDGNSLDLIKYRTWAAYNGYQITRGPSFLQALTHGPLLDYSDSKAFWQRHLENWYANIVPEKLARASSESITVVRTLSSTIFEHVRSAQNVTLQAVVLALWASVLQEWLSSDVTIGVVVSGRAIHLPDIEYSIGPLFNTLPFHSRNGDAETWASRVRACHEFNISTLDFQHVPLKYIQKWCSKGKALFDNLFTFQLETPRSDNECPWRIINDHAAADYTLALEVVHQHSGSLQFTLASKAGGLSSSILAGLLDRIEQNLRLMEASPDQTSVATARQQRSDPPTREESPIPGASANKFEWTDTANVLLHEISVLASTSSIDITETMSILELGLDSIDAIRLSSKLKKKNISLGPAQIMSCGTIAKMMDELSVLGHGQSENVIDHNNWVQNAERKLRALLASSNLNFDTVESVLPPTSLQDSMVAGMIQTNFESYFNHDILEIPEAIDIGRLEAAWREVVNQNPIYRTGFFEIEAADLDFVYCQVVFNKIDLDVQHLRLESPDMLHRIKRTAINLATSGNAKRDLFQLSFATVGSQRFAILSLAHALYDGWSLGLLYQDLKAAYEGRSKARPPASMFLASVAGSGDSKAGEFWTQYLQGASSTLVHQKPISENGNDSDKSNTGPLRLETVSKSSLEEAMRFCRNQAVSLQVLCQASWAAVLAQRVCSLDVSFGVVVSGRDIPGAEELAFPTMNTVAIRCILYGSPNTFVQYLEENMAEIRNFQNYPLRKAQLAAGLKGEALFNTLFIFQKGPEYNQNEGFLESVEGSSVTEYPLCVEAEVVSGRLLWRAASQPQYFSIDDLDGLLHDLDEVLQYFTRSGAPDIITFGDNSVSICELPAISAHFPTSTAGDAAPTFATADDEGWDENSAAIRKALSLVSHIPVDSIKKSDNLYHLGLDSISAIKVVSLLRKQMLHLKPQDLIKATSIQDMAASVDMSHHESDQKLDNIQPWIPNGLVNLSDIATHFDVQENAFEIIPALPMQVYMLSAWQNSGGLLFYPTFNFSIKGPIDVEQAQAAWDLLVEQQPILRTCFVATRSREIPFLQVILDSIRIPLNRTRAEAQSERVLPAVDAWLCKGEDESWLFQLRIHHALYDGVSLPSLLRRLSGLLGGSCDARVSSLEPWKALSVDRTSKAMTAVRQEFWCRYLSKCPQSKCQLRVVHDGTQKVSQLQRSAFSGIPEVRRIAAHHGISVQTIFLAAYAKALARRADAQGTVVFGVYLANRSLHDSVSSTYPTLNIVPLKAYAPPDRDLKLVAADIHHDIKQITAGGQVEVGLWEISIWTGVKISHFVNFLSLPDSPDAIQGPVNLVPADVQSQTNLSGSTQPVWLGSSIVEDQYPLAVDVEASIHGSELDIGVFALQQRVSQEDAVALISDIVAELNSMLYQ